MYLWCFITSTEVQLCSMESYDLFQCGWKSFAIQKNSFQVLSTHGSLILWWATCNYVVQRTWIFQLMFNFTVACLNFSCPQVSAALLFIVHAMNNRELLGVTLTCTCVCLCVFCMNTHMCKHTCKVTWYQMKMKFTQSHFRMSPVLQT